MIPQTDLILYKTNFQLSELFRVSNTVLRFINDYTIWLFHGEMGSGKTTLIAELCRQIGVNDDISSPTFSIVNEYRTDRGPVYHFDLYRLKNENELLQIGFEEYLDSGRLCLIEWPQKAMPFLPDKFLEINLTPTGPSERQIEVQAAG